MGLRNTKLTQYREEVKAAYEAGGTMNEIAHLYNVSIGTVRSELITQGVTIRCRGRRKNAKVNDEIKPEFTVSSLDPPVEEVPIEVAPDIPGVALPVESTESNRVIIPSDELGNIFGGNE